MVANLNFIWDTLRPKLTQKIVTALSVIKEVVYRLSTLPGEWHLLPQVSSSGFLSRGQSSEMLYFLQWATFTIRTHTCAHTFCVSNNFQAKENRHRFPKHTTFFVVRSQSFDQLLRLSGRCQWLLKSVLPGTIRHPLQSVPLHS